MQDFIDDFELGQNWPNNETSIFLSNQIFEEIHAFVFIFDIEKLIPVWINKYYETRMGYSKDAIKNLTGDQFLALFHPNSLKVFLNRISNYSNFPTSEKKTVYQLMTKDFKWLNMMVSTKVLKRTSEGKIKYLIGYGVEITGDELIKESVGLHELELKSRNLLNVDKLSKRELEIILNIANCLTDKEIAEKLKISIHTTKTHRKRIINKLGLKNTASLVKFAIESGLV